MSKLSNGVEVILLQAYLPPNFLYRNVINIKRFRQYLIKLG